MLVVLIILSLILYMIYSLVPANRAYTDANNQIKGMKGNPEELKAKFYSLYFEEGKEGNQAGRYNFTLKDLIIKDKILKEGKS